MTTQKPPELTWKQVGSRIYYRLDDGFILYNTGDREGTNIERDSVKWELWNIPALQGHILDETIGFIELPFGAHREDFERCVVYKVNTTTKQLEFIYRNPDNSETQPQEPTHIQIAQLRVENQTLTERLNASEAVILELLTK